MSDSEHEINLLQAESIGLLETYMNSNGKYSVAPVPCLKTTVDTDAGERDVYFASNAPGSHGTAVSDLLRHWNGEDAAQEPVYEWGDGTADALKAVIDETDATFEHAIINYRSGDLNAPSTVETTASLMTADEAYHVDTWTGVLAAALTDTDIRAAEQLWSVDGQLKEEYSLTHDFEDHVFYDIAAADYEPEPVDVTENTEEWTYDTFVRGSINSFGALSATEFHGMPYQVNPLNEETQIVLSTDGEQRSIPMSEIMLSDRALKDYKLRTGQNPHHLREDARKNGSEHNWAEFIHALARDEDLTHTITLENRGETHVDRTFGDEDLDARITAADPVEHYLTINDDTYRVPANDVQSIIPSLTETVQVINNYSDDEQERPMFR